MTEPQTWTVIVGFLTAIFAMLTIVTTSFNRTVRTEVGALRTEMRSEVGALRTEMASEFRRLDGRLDHLDRDVQALMRHVFDRPE